jgi:ubiquitin-conjugating enzyme E2 Q
MSSEEFEDISGEEELDWSDDDEEWEDDTDSDTEYDIELVEEEITEIQKRKTRLMNKYYDESIISFTHESSNRLIDDLSNMLDISEDYGIRVEVDSNLYTWSAYFNKFEGQLMDDLNVWAERYDKPAEIKLEIKFTNEYPMKPPFIRVIEPQFKFMTGHVTIGGSVCMEMLTNSGWSSANTLESVLINIHSEMGEGDGRIDINKNMPYNERDAKLAFDRMVNKYGWN